MKWELGREAMGGRKRETRRGGEEKEKGMKRMEVGKRTEREMKTKKRKGKHKRGNLWDIIDYFPK